MNSESLHISRKLSIRNPNLDSQLRIVHSSLDTVVPASAMSTLIEFSENKMHFDAEAREMRHLAPSWLVRVVAGVARAGEHAQSKHFEEVIIVWVHDAGHGLMLIPVGPELIHCSLDFGHVVQPFEEVAQIDWNPEVVTVFSVASLGEENHFECCEFERQVCGLLG